MKSILQWSKINKLVLNLEKKTKEIVITRPCPSKFSLRPKLADIEQASSAKLLGVYINDQVNMTEQLTNNSCDL